MRKLLFFSILLLAIVACSKESPEVQEEPTLVSISLDYDFNNTGSMTRSVDAQYTEFYNALVATKKITPDIFNLEFKETKTGMIYNFKGNWSKDNKFEILSGTYSVTGYSSPVTKTIDTLSLSFKEEITISNTTTSVSLNAANDCYLLLFNAEELQKIVYKAESTSYNAGSITINLKSFNNKLFYMYMRYFWYETKNNLTLTRKSGGTTVVNINENNFEKGKYYYFNDMSNSFSVPPMQPGN